MLINIDIAQKRPQVDGTPVIVCGNNGYQIRFTFDEEWAGLDYKTARFVFVEAGKPRHIDVPFAGDTVDVPVLVEVGFVLVGVYTDFLKTTTPAKIPCEYSIRCKSGEGVEAPTPELYDRMMEMYNRVGGYQSDAIQAAKTAAAANASAQEAASVAQEAIGGIVSKVIEGNSGRYVSFWVGTNAEYRAIGAKVENCMYIITDNARIWMTSAEDLHDAIRRQLEDMGADETRVISVTDDCSEDDAVYVDGARVDCTGQLTLFKGTDTDGFPQGFARINATSDGRVIQQSWIDEGENTWTAGAWWVVAGPEAFRATAKDISDQIRLSFVPGVGGDNLTELRVTDKYYFYDAARKMVFFVFGIYFRGTLAKGERLEFVHVKPEGTTAVYAPRKIGGATYPITARRRRFSGEYMPSGDDVFVGIYAEEDIDTDGLADGMDFSGWYYCDGEG